MPSKKKLKQLSGYLYPYQHEELSKIVSSAQVSESRFVRESVLYVMNNTQALTEVLEKAKGPLHRHG